MVALDVDLTSGQSDTINFAGNVSGTTRVVLDVRNALTTHGTTGDGITLFTAGGTTLPSNFSVVGNTSDNRLVSGAFQFDLAAVPGSNKLALQSSTFNGVFEYPDIGATTAAAFSLTNVSFSTLLDLLPGDGGQEMALNDSAVRLASADSRFVPYVPTGPGQFGIWARYSFGDLKASPHGAADFRVHTVTGQAGLDYAVPVFGGLGLAGVYLARGDSEIDLSASPSFGKARTTLYGGYLLWQGGPWKAAAMGSFGEVESDFTAPVTTTHTKVSPVVKSVGGMVSYRAALIDAIVISPRFEIGYSESNGFNFLDGTLTPVSVSGTRTTTLGFAARASRQFKFGGDSIEPFLDLGLQDKIGSKATARLSGLAFSADVAGVSGLMSAGARLRLGQSIAITAGANLIGGGRENGVEGMISLRYVR